MTTHEYGHAMHDPIAAVGQVTGTLFTADGVFAAIVGDGPWWQPLLALLCTILAPAAVAAARDWVANHSRTHALGAAGTVIDAKFAEIEARLVERIADRIVNARAPIIPPPAAIPAGPPDPRPTITDPGF